MLPRPAPGANCLLADVNPDLWTDVAFFGMTLAPRCASGLGFRGGFRRLGPGNGNWCCFSACWPLARYQSGMAMAERMGRYLPRPESWPP